VPFALFVVDLPFSEKGCYHAAHEVHFFIQPFVIFVANYDVFGLFGAFFGHFLIFLAVFGRFSGFFSENFTIRSYYHSAGICGLVITIPQIPAFWY